MVFRDEYCENCGKRYKNVKYGWCESCQIYDLKKNFTNWTSGNEKVDDLIQEMQLKIEKWYDIIIPYNQFNNIKEIGKDGFITIYSAIWKNGQLNYNTCKKIYKRILRNQNQKVSLKCYNSQNIADEFFNEVRNFFINLFYFIFNNNIFFCF